MVFYFSGTGNSEFVATSIATLTGDTAKSITGIEPGGYDVSAEEQIGFVFPIYAWSVPDIFQSFVSSLSLPKDIYKYAICTCGLDCGMAMDKLQNTLNLNAAISITMPNNYIISGAPDSDEECRARVKNAVKRLGSFALTIRNKESFFDYNRGNFPKFKSSLGTFGFKKFAVSDKSFFADDDCNSCGACQKMCQVGNIQIVDGKPKWNGNCIQCLACLNRCPKQAIQYTNATRDRGRYYFTDGLLE